jgi:membrane fusion protein, multidrug efflux system
MRAIITTIAIVLIGCLAFYPRLKGYFGAKDSKEGGDKPKSEKTTEGGKKEGGSDKKEGDKKGKGGPTPVNVMVITSQVLDNKIQTTGTIIPNEEVEVRSEISGRITGINFKEGQHVTQGQTLIKINDADLQAQLEKLGYQKKLAQVNEERQHKLLDKEAISQREYDISITNLNSINADIENLKAQIAKTVIRAPFNGRMGLRYVSMGSYLSPATKITTLTSVVPAKIDFSVPAKYANTVGRGTSISFTTENGSDNFKGTVYAVEPKIDPNTRTVMLRATSPNAGGKLIPGAFARIEIILNSNKGAIVIPTEAVIPDLKGHKVFVVRNKKAESVLVEIGTRTDRDVQIYSGLSIGDTLITSGILMVKPGGEVDIKEITGGH